MFRVEGRGGNIRWEREMSFGSIEQASGNLNCQVDMWCLWWADHNQ